MLGILLLPITLLLVLSPKWAFYASIGALTLDRLATGLTVSVPKMLLAVAFVAWAVSLLLSRRKARLDASFVMMVIYAGLGALSLLWTVEQTLTLIRFQTYILLSLMYLLIINSVQNEKQLGAMLTALWLAGMLLVSSGVYELATGLYRLNSHGRLSGILGNPNYYVIWGIATLPGFYWVIAHGRRAGTTFLAVVGIICFVITALFTASRGGVISAVVFFLVLLAFRATRARVLVLLACVAVLASQVAPPALLDRFALLVTKPSSSWRFKYLWPAGWAAFVSRPWLGHGVGTNGVVIGSRISASAMALPPLRMWGLTAHNAPLAIAVELGCVGLLLYLTMMGATVLRFWQTLRAANTKSQAQLYGLRLVVLASFAAFLASWLKGGGLEHTKALWLLLGLMESLSGIAHTADSRVGQGAYGGSD